MINESPIVTIRCTTYNHEHYIEQCLEGFVMQQTSFKFEAIVHDDASTDGTANIIRKYAAEYPDIIKPIYQKENQYSKKNGSIRKILNDNTRGKYIAICEGDDYWTDPLKLQKQVDFLEQNPKFSLTYTNYIRFIEKTQDFHPSFSDVSNNDSANIYNLTTSTNEIATLTTCFKREVLEQAHVHVKENPQWKMGDLPLWIVAASLGQIKYFNEITSVYRVLQQSASHFKHISKSFEFRFSAFECQKYFATTLKLDKTNHKILDDNIAKSLVKGTLVFSNDFTINFVNSLKIKDNPIRNLHLKFFCFMHKYCKPFTQAIAFIAKFIYRKIQN